MKEIASDMLTSEGYDHLGTDLESFVGRVKTAQRRIAAEAMAKKKAGAIQSKVNSFFRAKKKPQKQAGEDIEL